MFLDIRQLQWGRRQELIGSGTALHLALSPFTFPSSFSFGAFQLHYPQTQIHLRGPVHGSPPNVQYLFCDITEQLKEMCKKQMYKLQGSMCHSDVTENCSRLMPSSYSIP